jgi:hypothetical protein
MIGKIGNKDGHFKILTKTKQNASINYLDQANEVCHNWHTD